MIRSKGRNRHHYSNSRLQYPISNNGCNIQTENAIRKQRSWEELETKHKQNIPLNTFPCPVHLGHSPGWITSQVTKQVSLNFRTLKSYQGNELRY
jgi:hypothetical protein